LIFWWERSDQSVEFGLVAGADAFSLSLIDELG
jgi:hypothetical protein